MFEKCPAAEMYFIGNTPSGIKEYNPLDKL